MLGIKHLLSTTVLLLACAVSYGALAGTAQKYSVCVVNNTATGIDIKAVYAGQKVVLKQGRMTKFANVITTSSKATIGIYYRRQKADIPSGQAPGFMYWKSFDLQAQQTLYVKGGTYDPIELHDSMSDKLCQ